MSETPICGKCKRPILNQRDARHFGFFMAHQENECLRIVESELAAAKAELAAMTTERNSYKINASVYKNDAEKAEAERDAMKFEAQIHAPDVAGLVKRVNADLSSPIVSVAIADIGKLVDALLSQAARIRAMEEENAKLKVREAHAARHIRNGSGLYNDADWVVARLPRDLAKAIISDHPEGT